MLTDGPGHRRSGSVWVSPHMNSLITSCPKQSSYQEVHGEKQLNARRCAEISTWVFSNQSLLGLFPPMLMVKCCFAYLNVDCLKSEHWVNFQARYITDLQLSVNQPPTQSNNSSSTLRPVCFKTTHHNRKKSTLMVPREALFSNEPSYTLAICLQNILSESFILNRHI